MLLAGDQIIAGITPNVSVMSTEPEGSPLASWLTSMEKFRHLPEDTLVLAAHRLPFVGLHDRIDSVLNHHEEQMLLLEQACLELPKNAVELLPVLFKRELDFGVMSLAIGECLAHLHLLMEKGRIRRDLVDGVYQFTSIADDFAARFAAHTEWDEEDDETLMV